MALQSEALLDLIAKATRTSSGTGGTSLHGVGTHTGSYAAISVARGGTTVTAITAVNQAVPTDTLDLTDFNPDSVVLEKGDLFVCPTGFRFTSITVGAGAVSLAK